MTIEKELANYIKKGFENIKYLKKKIMVTHVHLADSKAEFSGWPGSKSIRKAVEMFKPDLLLCGHVHEAEGIEQMIGKNKVVNIGKNGFIFEI